MPLASVFSLGQNQAQQIQTQTHEPVPLSLAQDAREMHLQSDAVSEKEDRSSERVNAGPKICLLLK
jgi:hypothetical protein